MKKIKGALVALAAMAALSFANLANASVVTLSGSTAEGDIINVSFGVNDTTHVINSVAGTVDVASVGVMAVTGLMPLSASGSPFIFDQKYDPADPGASGFNWFGMAVFLELVADTATTGMANFFDDTPGLIFSANPIGTPTAYIPGHVVTEMTVTTVPEPATFLLLGLGIAGILVSGRRKTAENQADFGALAA